MSKEFLRTSLLLPPLLLAFLNQAFSDCMEDVEETAVLAATQSSPLTEWGRSKLRALSNIQRASKASELDPIEIYIGLVPPNDSQVNRSGVDPVTVTSHLSNSEGLEISWVNRVDDIQDPSLPNSLWIFRVRAEVRYLIHLAKEPIVLWYGSNLPDFGKPVPLFAFAPLWNPIFLDEQVKAIETLNEGNRAFYILTPAIPEAKSLTTQSLDRELDRMKIKIFGVVDASGITFTASNQTYSLFQIEGEKARDFLEANSAFLSRSKRAPVAWFGSQIPKINSDVLSYQLSMDNETVSTSGSLRLLFERYPRAYLAVMKGILSNERYRKSLLTARRTQPRGEETRKLVRSEDLGSFPLPLDTLIVEFIHSFELGGERKYIRALAKVSDYRAANVKVKSEDVVVFTSWK